MILRRLGLTGMAFVLCPTLCLAQTIQSIPSRLEFREIDDRRGVADSGTPIPADAVKVFTYEGQPKAVHVLAGQLAVEYDHSCVLFDPKTNQPVRRLTVADGWPEARPEGFPPPVKPPTAKLVGPGVLEHRAAYDESTHAAAVTIEFGGRTWQAMQPFKDLYKYPENTRDRMVTWSNKLRAIEAASYLQALPAGQPDKAVRYTTKEGLAGNMVTHLAAIGGKLWAASVDIYDPEAKKWTVGGLSCFDPAANRWQRVEQIDGRPARWITLLQVADGALWAGFREGDGVAGDSIAYGMGVYPGTYRPRATAIVLARLLNDEWKSWSRQPMFGSEQSADDRPRPATSQPINPEQTAPSEAPRRLGMFNGNAFLFSTAQEHSWGSFDVEQRGLVSILDPADGQWRTFDTRKDFDARIIRDLHVERAEAIVSTGRGAHRWMPHDNKWAYLDPRSPVCNPAIVTADLVGKELWFGANMQAFGIRGRQGIIKFNEETGQWGHISTVDIGTAAPVQSIVAMADGEVWVLFRQRFWMGSAGEFSIDRTEEWAKQPAGLARFRDGKWELPVKLDGVPAARQRERNGPRGKERWEEQLGIWQIIRLGERLYVVNMAGVFAGPGTFKQVVDFGMEMRGWDFPAVQVSADGKSLEVVRNAGMDETNKQKWERIAYDPATNATTTAPADRPAQPWEGGRRYPHGNLLKGNPAPGKPMEVSTRKPGRWIVHGLTDQYEQGLVQTLWAVWIVSPGQLVRLDRKLLGDWLAE